jgi:hypothetical protein
MFYQKEIFPEHIKFVKDTNENRRLLEEKLGKTKFLFGDYSYIEINTKDNTWRNCMDFEWLYRDTPPLISIEEFINL